MVRKEMDYEILLTILRGLIEEKVIQIVNQDKYLIQAFH